MKKVCIIGAGLAGTLMALYLGRRDYEVEVYEARPDIRKKSQEAGRSINLALSCRGITSLKKLGLMDEVNQILVPMRARAIHEEDGSLSYQAFGRHKEEYINAIMRKNLNSLLLDKAEASPNIHLHFEMELVNVDLHTKRLLFSSKNGSEAVPYEHLIGADGAASKLREAMKAQGKIVCKREFLQHGYKELSISREHSKNMAKEHLHLWPRDSFMLLGNPNLDDSITGSLFLPNEGEDSFASLKEEVQLTSFFKRVFPDAYHLMPNLAGEFFNNPTGNLSTVACKPWYYRDQCLIIGDAAHGIVPFFGQGMNCAFEDCRILAELLEQYQDDWEKTLPAFYQQRKENTDAVAELSMDNYREIQHDIRDKKFLLKKQLEQELMQRYPDRYISKHVEVMFTNVPYKTALAHGRLQTELLEEITLHADTLKEIDWNLVDKAMLQYDKKLADSISVK